MAKPEGMTKVAFNMPLSEYSRLMQRAQHAKKFVSAYCREAVIGKMDAETAPSIVPSETEKVT